MMSNIAPYCLILPQISAINLCQPYRTHIPWVPFIWQSDFLRLLLLNLGHIMFLQSLHSSWNPCWTQNPMLSISHDLCPSVLIQDIGWLFLKIIERTDLQPYFDCLSKQTLAYVIVACVSVMWSLATSLPLCLKSSVSIPKTIWHHTNQWPMSVFIPYGKILIATLTF